jgi:LemA protein
MSKTVGCVIGIVLAAILVGVWAMGQYNGLVGAEQEVAKAWSQVESVYQRRADLIPNLVETVKGAANFEQETLTQVIEARAKATQTTIGADVLNDPAKFAQFQQAQDQLSGALSRLMVVVERYPELKSVANFTDLMHQLEGTENRITVARNRYIKAVQEYNTAVVQFPTNLTAMVFGFKEKPQFTVENEKEISKSPKVDFGR